MIDLKRNKRNVAAFYELMFNDCKPREAVETYAGAEYIQHNPHVGDGKEAFITYFEKMAAEYPDKRVEIKRAFADGSAPIGAIGVDMRTAEPAADRFHSHARASDGLLRSKMIGTLQRQGNRGLYNPVPANFGAGSLAFQASRPIWPAAFIRASI